LTGSQDLPCRPIFNEAINMTAVARDLSSRLSDGENARFIVNVLLQTDTTKIFFSRFAFNYFGNKWNDTTILHDLSSSFLPSKTSTFGNELAIAEDLSAFGFP
jgi:hypothetical protein